MTEASAALQFERAAALRDRREPLEWLWRHLERLRKARTISGIYEVTNHDGARTWYVLKHGVVRRALTVPEGEEEQSAAASGARRWRRAAGGGGAGAGTRSTGCCWCAGGSGGTRRSGRTWGESCGAEKTHRSYPSHPSHQGVSHTPYAASRPGPPATPARRPRPAPSATRRGAVRVDAHQEPQVEYLPGPLRRVPNDGHFPRDVRHLTAWVTRHRRASAGWALIGARVRSRRAGTVASPSRGMAGSRRGTAGAAGDPRGGRTRSSGPCASPCGV